MKRSSRWVRLVGLITLFVLIGTSVITAQETSANANKMQLAAGQKVRVQGVIVNVDADTFLLRNHQAMDVTVLMRDITQVKERRRNPFRSPKNFSAKDLVRGLNVEVRGSGNSSGDLVAESVRFTDEDLKVANLLESRVYPVEGRLSKTETRLGEAEQNAQRLSGQIDELSAVSNAARGGAKAAQETADQAVAGLSQANDRIEKTQARINKTDERIAELDNYEAKSTETILFKVGSWTLTDDAKATLDGLAQQAALDHGYLVEVTGFASADGSEVWNRQLSRLRADTVVQYLADNHQIPLRRVIRPHGFGENMPVADNKTREGRQQNRRVEVRILVNKGIVQSAGLNNPEN